MAQPKVIRTKAGVSATPDFVQVPRNWEDVHAAILQLQDSINEVAVAHNTHVHAADGDAGDTDVADVQVTGDGAAAADVFTDPAAT